MFLRSVLSLLVIFSALTAARTHAAVVLQYHHVDSTTPRITSITREELRTHIKWLIDHKFEIISLNELIKALENKTLDQNAKIASLTFDDLSPSICRNAWPILNEYKIPFTIFVNTSRLEKQIPEKNEEDSNDCSIEMIEQMVDSGLLQLANHSHSHPHMLSHSKENNKHEIILAQKILEQTFRVKEKIFAYPYGEFNDELESLTKNLGYVAFGQQSGAIGNHSNLQALPRFPLSGAHANIETLPDKLLSLPFPIKKIITSPNPSISKAPILKLYFYDVIPDNFQCFTGDGAPVESIKRKNYVLIQAKKKLQAGRVRYNCTAPSTEKGRYYWFSQQWLYQEK